MEGGYPPTAGFYADVTSGPTPLTVHLYDQSTGATSWWYDFGDGTGQWVTSHPYAKTYAAPGIYTVRQVVQNADGEAELTRTDYITVYDEDPQEKAVQAAGVWRIFQRAALKGMKGKITDETDTQKF